MVDSKKRYKAYPEYKDSGVEWLDEIPRGWSILRGKYVFYELKERSTTGAETLLSVSEYFGVKPRSENILEGEHLTRAESLEGYKKCYKNDLVMNIMLAWKRGLGVSKFEGIVSPAYSVFRFKENAYPYYMHNLFRTDLYTGHFKTRSTGVIDSRLRLYPESFFDTDVLLPTYQEQQKIANFLDHETAKIDILIEKQQRLIELLTEKRQAVISHAVTKGLNPDVPMKNSGVEWLGEVPEHWEVERFKTIFKIRKRIAGELGHDVLSITQKGIKIKDTESGEGQLSMDYSKYQLVYKGDYAMNHMDLLTGFVDISKYDGVTSPDYRVFTLEEKNSLPEYFLAFLQMGYINKLFFPFGQGAAHMGRWRLPTEAFREFLAPVPPKNEQKAIADFIFNSLEQMDILEKKSRKAIKLMQERRTALISAAVTGKIDVRDWVKPE